MAGNPYNSESVETQNTVIILFHENLCCYKDLRSYIFYFETSWSETGACDVMSCLEMSGCNQCCSFTLLLLKIILEPLKIDLFEGQHLQYQIHAN